MISIKYSHSFMEALGELSKKEVATEFYTTYGSSVYAAIREVHCEFEAMRVLQDTSYGFCPRLKLSDEQVYAIKKYTEFMKGK